MRFSSFYMTVLVGGSLGLSTLAFSEDRIPAGVSAIQQEISAHSSAYEDLRELTSQIGPRPSGSANAERAVAWGIAKMQSYHFAKVVKQPVTVPHWVRGNNEKASIMGVGAAIPLAVAALGRSGGTPGIDSEVIEVKSLDEVRALGAQVHGKIVFYNRPMDPSLPDTFTAYGRAMDQRTSGPSTAARLGAVAVLVRSLTTLADDDHPHTGGTYFPSGVDAIPAAALSAHAANILSQNLHDHPNLKVHLELSASTLPDLTSYNVIGEVTGREIPNEIVLVGGHIDSWDLAQGAHDDGTGVTQTLDVCRALIKLDIHPRRTVRCVLFMTEEMGGIGADEYAKQAEFGQEHHVMAVESDRGGFAPEKFSVNGSAQQVQDINSNIGLFAGTGIQSVYQGGAGTDVDPLASQGTLTMELVPNSAHYFDYHHAATDRFEAVDATELKNGASALATMVYYFAEKN